MPGAGISAPTHCPGPAGGLSAELWPRCCQAKQASLVSMGFTTGRGWRDGAVQEQAGLRQVLDAGESRIEGRCYQTCASSSERAGCQESWVPKEVGNETSRGQSGLGAELTFIVPPVASCWSRSSWEESPQDVLKSHVLTLPPLLDCTCWGQTPLFSSSRLYPSCPPGKKAVLSSSSRVSDCVAWPVPDERLTPPAWSLETDCEAAGRYPLVCSGAS